MAAGLSRVEGMPAAGRRVPAPQRRGTAATRLARLPSDCEGLVALPLHPAPRAPRAGRFSAILAASAIRGESFTA